jgi:hypothetical protein
MTIAVADVRVQRATPTRAPRLLGELRRRAFMTGSPRVLVRVDELAAALSVSERTVQRAAADLVTSEFITVTQSPSQYGPNVYHLIT